MSTDNADRGPPVQAQRKFISQSITSLYVAIDKVHQETASRGDVSEETKQQLQSELATVTMLLRPHRSDNRVDWETATPFEDGPDHLVARLLEGDTEMKRPDHMHNPTPREVAKPAEFGLEELYSSANDMLEMAHSLGLTAGVKQEAAEEHPDPI